MWGWRECSGTRVVPCYSGEGNWGRRSRARNDGTLGFYGSSANPTVATQGSSSFVRGDRVGSIYWWCGPVSVASQCSDRNVFPL